MRGLVVAVLMWSAAGAALAQVKPETRTFRDWLVVCDNGLKCTAFGRSAGESQNGWVRLEMEAGPAAQPKVQLGYWDNGEGGPVARFSATIDGHPLRTTTNLNGRPALVGDPARAALRRMTGGAVITLTGGSEPGAISLSGASAALLFIDEKQGRLDTVTALIRRGARPASAVPAAPVLPRLTAAAAIRQTGMEEARLPPSIRSLPAMEECTADSPDGPVERHRLGADEILWVVGCTRGAYNFGTRQWITTLAGTRPRPVLLPTATAGPTEYVINGGYDADTRMMVEFNKGRGLGDCGVARSWLWTGQRFELASEQAMEDCFGVVSDLWPDVWRTRWVN